jgi:pimeloyl-ACP methyl ester carboxylesterase
LIIGQEDRTVVGKNLLNEEQKKIYGNYPALGKKIKSLVKNSTLVELPGVGHIPHIQSFELFKTHLLAYLEK